MCPTKKYSWKIFRIYWKKIFFVNFSSTSCNWVWIIFRMAPRLWSPVQNWQNKLGVNTYHRAYGISIRYPQRGNCVALTYCHIYNTLFLLNCDVKTPKNGFSHIKVKLDSVDGDVNGINSWSLQKSNITLSLLINPLHKKITTTLESKPKHYNVLYCKLGSEDHGTFIRLSNKTVVDEQRRSREVIISLNWKETENYTLMSTVPVIL